MKNTPLYIVGFCDTYIIHIFKEKSNRQFSSIIHKTLTNFWIFCASILKFTDFLQDRLTFYGIHLKIHLKYGKIETIKITLKEETFIMKEIRNQTYDMERALYASRDTLVESCTFAGPADGESAFKESHGVTVRDCHFSLRYPFWHNEELTIEHCDFADTARAPLWYSHGITMRDTHMLSVKAFRECGNIVIENSTVVSPEFGWNCHGIRFAGSDLTGEYFLLGASDIHMEHTHFKGKYSFQYVKNAVIRSSILDTKDAFWHAENVTVYDSEVRGEYLGWYAKNLRFVRCHIAGTQPLCYAESLILEDCTMDADCDLCFEYSTVSADIKGGITSVKNPVSGHITADSIGKIILDENLRPGSDCVIKG